MHHIRFETPIGELLIVANKIGLTYVAFSDENHAACTHQSTQKMTPILKQARTELSDFFAGKRKSFTVPLAWPDSAKSGFRGEVQQHLLTIPFGEQRTYKQLAVAIGNPGAVRAVGSACATNPLPIFAPCHRVLRTDGSLGGYRGGLEAKQWLLELESQGGSS